MKISYSYQLAFWNLKNMDILIFPILNKCLTNKDYFQVVFHLLWITLIVVDCEIWNTGFPIPLSSSWTLLNKFTTQDFSDKLTYQLFQKYNLWIVFLTVVNISHPNSNALLCEIIRCRVHKRLAKGCSNIL